MNKHIIEQGRKTATDTVTPFSLKCCTLWLRHPYSTSYLTAILHGYRCFRKSAEDQASLYHTMMSETVNGLAFVFSSNLVNLLRRFLLNITES